MSTQFFVKHLFSTKYENKDQFKIIEINLKYLSKYFTGKKNIVLKSK